MEKVIKCILLDVDNVIITEMLQIDAEIGDPDCKLLNPYRFYSKDDMRPWPEATYQADIMIRSSDILTIAEPTAEIIEKYLELTK